MKKYPLLFLIFVCFSASRAFSQIKTPPNSYEIIHNTLVSQEDFYKQSIEMANLENYRLKNQRVSLSFENGFVVELISAEELYSKNNSVDLNSYQSEFPVSFILPTFKIIPTGELVAIYLKLNKG